MILLTKIFLPSANIFYNEISVATDKCFRQDWSSLGMWQHFSVPLIVIYSRCMIMLSPVWSPATQNILVENVGDWLTGFHLKLSAYTTEIVVIFRLN